MDTKFVAMVGALVVLGGIVYLIATGSILPGDDEPVEGADDSIPDQMMDGDGQDEANETAQAGGNETAQNSGNETDRGEGEEGYPPATVGCRVKEGDMEVEEVYSKAGPPFDAKKAESMLHDAFNELREAQTGDDVGPLLCNPEMREVAQNHSEYMGEKGFLGPNRPDEETIAERYLDACTEPDVRVENLTVGNTGGGGKSSGQTIIINGSHIENGENFTGNITVDIKELYGRWLYQRNQMLNWDNEETPLSQRIDVVEDHEDLVRDIRGAWVKAELDEVVSDANMSHQGIGMHINRETRLVHVTHAICDYQALSESGS